MATTSIGSSGVTFPDATTLATSAGSAKAWVSYNATTSTILASYNVSSVTLNSAGKQTVNFTTAFSDANYCIAGSQAVNSGSGQTGIGIGDTGTSGTNPTTTACQIYTANVGGAYTNSTRMSAAFYR